MAKKGKAFLGIETETEIGLFVSIQKNGEYHDYNINFVDPVDCRSLWLPEPIKGFKIRGISSKDFSTVYGIRFTLETCHYYAEKSASMLAKMRKNIAELERMHGEIKTFGQYVNTLAIACGIKQVLWYNYATGTKDLHGKELAYYVRRSPVGQCVSELDYSIFSMTEEREKPITGISLT